jgi:hypothetical protein
MSTLNSEHARSFLNLKDQGPTEKKKFVFSVPKDKDLNSPASFFLSKTIN